MNKMQVIQRKTADNKFFMNDHQIMAYAEKCLKCRNDCKQSFRVTVVRCPRFKNE